MDISIPNYLHTKLLEYNHKDPKQIQNCPYAPPPIKYGKTSDIVIQEKTSPPATEKAKQYYNQKVLGSFLCYVHIIGMTILHTPSSIASEQHKPTKHMFERVQQLLS